MAVDLEVEDLNWILQESGYAQAQALRALGVDLVEAPTMLSLTATGMAPLVSLVAHGLPANLLARATSIVDAALEKTEPIRGWRRALMIVFQFFHTDPNYIDRAHPEDSVPKILNFLRLAAGSLPKRLEEPLPQHIASAVEVIRNLPTIRAKGGGRDGALTPWGAARRFAEAFGIPSPQSEYDAKRSAPSE